MNDEEKTEVEEEMELEIDEEKEEVSKEKGVGRMGGPEAAGPGGKCVCPKCGKVIEHKRAEPCMDIECPECGIKMTRK